MSKLLRGCQLVSGEGGRGVKRDGRDRMKRKELKGLVQCFLIAMTSVRELVSESVIDRMS